MAMRVFVSLVSLLLFVGPEASKAQTGPVPPQPLSIPAAVTHIYKSSKGAELRLHIFTPVHSVAEPRPAIVFFFGGGWTNGTIEQFVPQAKHLAKRGMVTIVADYRVAGRHQTTPFESMEDAQSAIGWIRARAAELGVDSNRIVASGGSSGGHIALSAAVFGNAKSRPNALVLFNPVVDISVVSQPERFGTRWREASPFHHIRADLPPTLILHGRDDTAVSYSTVERYCVEARSLHNRCELIGYDGATHGFFNPGREGGKWYRETLLEADRFLTSLKYIVAPSPERIIE